MVTLIVPDMSCSHCSGVITKALKQLDPSAVIGFDMHNHRVQVETTEAGDAVMKVMAAAGYPATPA